MASDTSNDLIRELSDKIFPRNCRTSNYFTAKPNPHNISTIIGVPRRYFSVEGKYKRFVGSTNTTVYHR